MILSRFSIITIYLSWDFSLTDDVRLYSKELVDAFSWQGDTDYLVYKAQELED